MGTAVIVIDMVRGFLEKGHPLYCGEAARSIIPCVRRLLQHEMERGAHILYLVDTHSPDDKEFEMFPPHCIKGTKEAEVLPELFEAVRKKVLIPTVRFSGFYKTSLELYLAGFAPEVVEVVGVCTDICVFFTVEGLRYRDYRVRVYREGVASFDREAHDFALQQMEKVLGAEVV